MVKHDDVNEEAIYSTTICNNILRFKKGFRYEFEEFHKLRSGGIYILEAATERIDLKQYTGKKDESCSGKAN